MDGRYTSNTEKRCPIVWTPPLLRQTVPDASQEVPGKAWCQFGQVLNVSRYLQIQVGS